MNKHTTISGATVDFIPMKRHVKILNPEDKFPHDPGGSIICQLIKYVQKFFAVLNGYIYMILFYKQDTSYMKWKENTT